MIYDITRLLFAWGCTSLVLVALWAAVSIVGRYRYERELRRRNRRP
jgi:hypothetical protein